MWGYDMKDRYMFLFPLKKIAPKEFISHSMSISSAKVKSKYQEMLLQPHKSLLTSLNADSSSEQDFFFK